VKHEALTQQLIVAFYPIYNELGHGFLESIYQKAFSVVLGEKGLRFQEQAPIELYFMECLWETSRRICSWTRRC
jgi:GxxExxY protein